MKTALQLLILKIDIALSETTAATTIGILHGIRSDAVKLLPTEREQIEQAFRSGHNDGVSDPENLSCFQPHDYFTKTYEI